eukprot:COSAG02_NODE_28741_length_583_cov_1.334711_1_plen_23_part_10
MSNDSTRVGWSLGLGLVVGWDFA